MEYDWRTRFGFGVSKFLSREMSWAEAWALTSQLVRDPDSHVTASLLGWSFVPGPQARAATDLLEAYVNLNRRKHATPFHAERPWAKTTLPTPGRVSEEDRSQRERLDHLLFGGGPITD